jgi:molybdopterin-containing oxidoreductase family membrane subunit
MRGRVPATSPQPEAGQQEITRDILRRYQGLGPGFWTGVALTALLFLAGVVGFAWRLQGGFQNRAAWGYYAATFAFLLSTVQAAPLVAIGLRLTKADWRRPLSRASELFAVASILNVLLLLPLLPLLPSVEGRASLWFEWAAGKPRLWDTLALAFLILCGLALLYASARPDLAAARDQGGGARSRLASLLASGWRGDGHQWLVLGSSLTLLGGLYLLAYVFSHTLLSVDLAMSLVPGWRSAIFPAYHTLTSLLGGLAALTLALALMRRTGFSPYLKVDHFWGLAKLLLTLSLLSIYFWWSEFLVFWYGRTPQEQTLFQLLMVGPYRPLFLLGFFLAFLFPLLALIWNQVRRSILGPTIVSVAVLIGLFLDRIRLYVAAFAASRSGFEPIDQVPAAHFPDPADLLIMVGLPAGAILLYLLASRLVPAVSLWEVKGGLFLRVRRRYLEAEYESIGKPD